MWLILQVKFLFSKQLIEPPAFGNLLKKFDLNGFSGKRVALKANYNSADPFPASTHLDTLRALVETLKAFGSGSITLAERSGMGDTEEVLQKMGVFALAEELGFEAIVLNDIR